MVILHRKAHFVLENPLSSIASWLSMYFIARAYKIKHNMHACAISLPRPTHGSSPADLRLTKHHDLPHSFWCGGASQLRRGWECLVAKPLSLSSWYRMISSYSISKGLQMGCTFPTSWFNIIISAYLYWQLGWDHFTDLQSVFCLCAGNWFAQCFQSPTPLSNTEKREASWNLRVRKPLNLRKHIRVALGLQLLVDTKNVTALSHTDVMVIISI